LPTGLKEQKAYCFQFSRPLNLAIPPWVELGGSSTRPLIGSSHLCR